MNSGDITFVEDKPGAGVQLLLGFQIDPGLWAEEVGAVNLETEVCLLSAQ